MVTKTAKKNRNLPGVVEHAYVLKDKTFGEFRVQTSANAWYRNKVKLEQLISAFKYGANIKQAIISAGISAEQWKYFIGKHPEFYTIINTCRQIPTLRALKTVVDSLSTDLPTARWYLERKVPEEFGRNSVELVIDEHVKNRMAEIRERYGK